MISDLRYFVNNAMESYRELLKPDSRNWKVLEVGIDGDQRPGGNYKYFGLGNIYKTLDFLERLGPDYVADITDTKMPDDEWDLIILSQTLEHVYDYGKAISECYRMLKKGGHLIVDCPFEYPYHGLPDYDDYWRMTHKALKRVLEDYQFEVVASYLTGGLVATALAKK